ncbi:MAG: hypothetical protein ACSHXZ_14955 [Gammaproteobacteria bacterium]
MSSQPTLASKRSAFQTFANLIKQGSMAESPDVSWLVKDILTPVLKDQNFDESPTSVGELWRLFFGDISKTIHNPKFGELVRQSDEDIQNNVLNKWSKGGAKAHLDIAQAAYYYAHTSSNDAFTLAAEEIDKAILGQPFEELFGAPVPTTAEESSEIENAYRAKKTNTVHISKTPHIPRYLKNLAAIFVFLVLLVPIYLNFDFSNREAIAPNESASSAETTFQDAMEHLKLGENVEYFNDLTKANTEGLVQATAAIGIAYERGVGVAPDITLADKFAKQAYDKGLISLAQGGDRDAQYMYGLMLITGLGGKADANEGIRWLENAYLNGHSRAPLHLASMYRLNSEIADDCKGRDLAAIARKAGHIYAYSEEARFQVYNLCTEKEAEIDAVTLLKKGSQFGDLEAEFLLGWMYDHGRGVPQSDEIAVDWYEKAAVQGSAGAQNSLGWMYENGRGVPQSDENAVDWYKKAAVQGSAGAQNSLGWMYDKGRGVPQSDETAVDWYKKAASQGSAGAQTNLGWMYEEGRGVPQSDETAVDWYKKAADQGYARAQTNLGWMYEEGRGVPQSDENAVGWYEKAADQGYARAQTNLGWMYEEGRGVPQSDENAVGWYRKAANQGYARAQTSLGWMYKYGRGIAQDTKQALLLFENAAAQNYGSAYYNIGLLYEEGSNELKRDVGTATKAFQTAAELGSSNAFAMLGWYAKDGEGGPVDYTLAEDMFLQGIEAGSLLAKSGLGRMYINGEGFEQSIKKGVELCREAKAEGDVCSADYCIGLAYFSQDTEIVSPKEAEDALRSSAEMGNRCAQTLLGVALATGEFNDTPLIPASSVFRELILNVRIIDLLQLIGRKIEGYYSRLMEADYWLERAANSGQGHEQFNYAVFLMHYFGFPPEDERIIRYLDEAADYNHPIANCSLAAYYLYDKEGATDLMAAHEYLQRLRDMKNSFSHADANKSLTDPYFFASSPIASQAYAKIFTAADLKGGVISTKHSAE